MIITINGKTFEIQNLSNVRSILESHPELRGFLIGAILTDHNFKLFVKDIGDISTVLRLFPEQQEAVATKVARHLSDFLDPHNFLRIAILFPQHVEILIKAILQDTSLQSYLCMSHLEYILDNFSLNYFRSSKREVIFKLLLTEINYLSKLIGSYDLKKFMEIFPGKKDIFLDVLLSHPDFLNALAFQGNLPTLAAMYPRHKEKFFGISVGNPLNFRNAVPDIYALKPIVATYPKLKGYLGEQARANFSQLVKNRWALKKILKLFPDQIENFLRIILKNAALKIFFDIHTLEYLIKQYPHKQEAIFRLIASDIPLLVGNNPKQLCMLTGLFPERTDYIFHAMFVRREFFEKVIHDRFNFSYLTCAFADHPAIVLEMETAAHSPEIGYEKIKANWRKHQIQSAFPVCVAFQKLFNLRKEAEQNALENPQIRGNRPASAQCSLGMLNQDLLHHIYTWVYLSQAQTPECEAEASKFASAACFFNHNIVLKSGEQHTEAQAPQSQCRMM